MDQVEKGFGTMIDDLLAPEDFNPSELENASLEISSLNSALDDLFIVSPCKIKGARNNDLAGTQTEKVHDPEPQVSGVISKIKAESWDTGGY